MSFWRSMPEGMKLRSNMRATNMVEPAGPLSLQAYMDDTGARFEQPVPLSDFINYGLWVQRNAVPDVDNRLVTRVERQPAGFALQLTDGGRVTARRVVVACGIAQFAHVPSRFQHLSAELVSHTGQRSDMGAFAGRRVVVVGGGQSALESAVLMQERGADVEVMVRGSRVVYLHGRGPINYMGPLGPIVYAPTDVGPLWYSRLVATPVLFRRLSRNAQTRIADRSIRPACSNFVRVRLGDVKLSIGLEVASAERSGSGLRLRLSDGAEREADHLLFGTGYRVDVARYPFLSAEILRDLSTVKGSPVLQRGLESSVPGLHFLGAPAAWSFGPILRFVSGSWYAARAVTREVTKSHRRRPRERAAALVR
jgi:cation diffusion facilitator CzcD-associated flavoprotein CzcO